jgi:MAPEG family
MALDSTQTGVVRGMAAAVAIAAGVFLFAYLAQWPNVANQIDLGSRLKLAALATLAPTTALFVCIARLAKHRFSTPQDIQGSALPNGTDRARLLQALLQNTLEQAVLAVPVYFCAALIYPKTLLPLVVCSAALFVVGRLLFFRGYAGGATSRAAGFGLTFYPSVALLISVVALALLPSAG